jgi:hypothetical protein
MSRAVPADTTITLASSGPEVTVPASLVVLAGQSSAPVMVTGVTGTDGGVVTVTATYGTDGRTASVRVLNANDVPTLVALEPAGTLTVATGSSTQFTVRLDVPPSADTQVSLMLSTPVGTVPATVTVLADQTSATFAFVAGAMPGMASLSATLGSVTLSTSIDVSATPPVTNLVINEVDYDMPGAGDSAEFVEIFNGTGSPVDLTGYSLVLVNGNGGTTYATISLASAGTLGPDEYLVVGSSATVASLPTGAKAVTMPGTADLIQNGAPDAVMLIGPAGIDDALSYEGSTTANGVAVQEGAASTAALTDPGAGSICRIPNGADTNVNATDFSVCATVTKGAANAP